MRGGRLRPFRGAAGLHDDDRLDALDAVGRRQERPCALEGLQVNGDDVGLTITLCVLQEVDLMIKKVGQ